MYRITWERNGSMEVNLTYFSTGHKSKDDLWAWREVDAPYYNKDDTYIFRLYDDATGRLISKKTIEYFAEVKK